MVAIAFALPLLAHGNENLEDFLDRYGVNAALYRLFESRFQHIRCPVPVMNREIVCNLDLRDLPGKFLPLCNEPDNPAVHF